MNVSRAPENTAASASKDGVMQRLRSQNVVYPVLLTNTANRFPRRHLTSSSRAELLNTCHACHPLHSATRLLDSLILGTPLSPPSTQREAGDISRNTNIARVFSSSP